MAANKDGSFGSKATAKDLAELYGEAAKRAVTYLIAVHPNRWDDYLFSLVQDVRIAAHHGRKSLRQTKLR